MFRAKNVTRFVAAVALIVGFAFAIPPASAAEEDADAPDPGVSTTSAIPACASNPEVSAGPATVGLDYYCERYAEVDTDLVHCDVYQDKETDVDCETAEPTSSTAGPGPDVCIPFTHEGEIGPVTYVFTGCDVDVSIQTDLHPPGDEDLTERCSVNADEDPKLALVECQMASTSDANNCMDIYWKHQIGPVIWEQTSSCDGEVYLDKEWSPSDEVPN